MINTFEAIGYHGTDKQYVNDILEQIDYSFNRGDKFLGQGMYLWRDSYDRAVQWAIQTKGYDNFSILVFKIKCYKENVLNFTSNFWGNEEMLLNIWSTDYSYLSFGEFLDEMIYNQGMSVNMILIMDLTKDKNVFNIIDGDNETNFALGDIQICLKNDIPIKNYGEI